MSHSWYYKFMLVLSNTRLGLALALSFVLLLAGCGGLQDVSESQGAKLFHPQAIAVLPPMASQYDTAREEIQEVLAGVLRKSSRIERVVSPETVTDVFQASKAAFDALVVYISRLEMTGHSDKDSALILGRALNVDSFLVVRVNSWEYPRGVGLSLRLIDATTGATIWKARHEQSASYWFFRTDLKDIAAELADEMIKSMPPHVKR